MIKRIATSRFSGRPAASHRLMPKARTSFTMATAMDDTKTKEMAVPALSPDDFREYNHMAEHMQLFVCGLLFEEYSSNPAN